MATTALSTEEDRFNARMALHANDVADALPDDPEEAMTVLIGCLAMAMRVSLDLDLGPVPDRIKPALHRLVSDCCDKLREAAGMELVA